MSILNSVRYLLSRASSALGMKEALRSFYMGKANNYVFNLDPEAVSSAWIRRSVTNNDFSPFLSDVDLTIVIDEKKMNLIHLHDDLLVKDVQIVPASFLDSWLSAGGFRNYLQGEWIPLRGSPIPQSHFPIEDGCLAFDLGHEIYLLYHQLEKKLHLFNEPYTNHSRKKILQDLIKVKKFWLSKDFTILIQARESFQIPETIERFMNSFSQFCKDLSSHLQTPLNTFRCSDLMIKDYADYFEINLEMVGKKVIALFLSMSISALSS
jgi:hypothetical protein